MPIAKKKSIYEKEKYGRLHLMESCSKNGKCLPKVKKIQASYDKIKKYINNFKDR